uniref:Knottin scorpion toxin-like domain-containing protein n=1 Tax=Oryza glaberrima TaxID=4538 RepID=I1QFJ2_ORYGL
MEATSLDLRFILVLVLLLNPTFAEDCIIDIGWVVFCTKRLCKFSCWGEGLIKKGKVRDYWCSDFHGCNCLICRGS